MISLRETDNSSVVEPEEAEAVASVAEAAEEDSKEEETSALLEEDKETLDVAAVDLFPAKIGVDFAANNRYLSL
jgi:hypothetical protein